MLFKVHLNEKILPSVTIGVCVRNSERTIGKNIESIINLDYPKSKFCLLVVDGCSTDRTVQIIQETLKDSNIDFTILSDNGQGLSFARQMVVDRCNSKYVLWVDGDNLLATNFLKTQAQFMENNPKAGFCGVRTAPLGKSVVSRLQGYQWTIPVSDLARAGYKIGKTGIQGTICRMDAIRNVGGFDRSIEGAGEDVDLFIRMKIAGWEMGFSEETPIYHFMRDTWTGLWRESVWWGYGTSYIASKHKSFFPALKRRAGFAITDCIKLTFKSFELTHDLGCVLMPIHYGIRRLGFLVGHWRANNNNYSYKKQ